MYMYETNVEYAMENIYNEVNSVNLWFNFLKNKF